MPASRPQTWEVVGGAVSGGLLVRVGKGLGTERATQRLHTGALVEQIELDGDRLNYRLLRGKGPAQGWVSVRLSDKELLQRCSAPSPLPKEEDARTGSRAGTDTATRQLVQMEILGTALNVASMVQHGPRFRVTKVCSEHLLEVAPSESEVRLEEFWPEDCTLSAERRHYLYWAIVCCSSCDTWTLGLALALKELSDHGILLTHDGRPVLNVVVLNTPTMDISDLLPNSVEFLEPVSGARIPLFSTPASQLALKTLGPEVQERLGWGVASMFDEKLRETFVAEFGEGSLTDTVPHWWVAAVVQGDYGLYMVHIDLCGPAYGAFCGSSSFGKTLPIGKELPIDVFITPYQLMVPADSKQLFFVHSEVVSFSPHDAKFTSLQRIRHFRCFFRKGGGYVTATPLPTYVDDKLKNSWLQLRTPSSDATPSLQGWQDELQAMASFLRVELFRTLETGTYVEVQGVSERKDLDGKLGKILASTDPAYVELLVQFDDLQDPVRVQPSSLKLYPQYAQYLTLVEMYDLALLHMSLFNALSVAETRMPSELISYLRMERR